MTKAEFDTVSVGDIILCASGIEALITDIQKDTLHYQKTSSASGPIYKTPWGNFGYRSHISKGTNYGTHRTLRHEADFKAKP